MEIMMSTTKWSIFMTYNTSTWRSFDCCWDFLVELLLWKYWEINLLVKLISASCIPGHFLGGFPSSMSGMSPKINYDSYRWLETVLYSSSPCINVKVDMDIVCIFGSFGNIVIFDSFFCMYINSTTFQMCATGLWWQDKTHTKTVNIKRYESY